MAKKKTTKKSAETSVITIDLDQLASENDKYIGDLARFIEEKVADIKIEREKNNLTLTVAKNFSRRAVRDYLKRFLYITGLNATYRPIALQESEKGYKIYKKPEVE